MLDLIRSIFGVYTPITYGPDNIIPAGLAGVNMEYVLGGVLFGIVLICFFKILGSILSKL